MPLGIARAQRGRGDLVEQARRPIGGRAERPQVTSSHSRRGQPAARQGDLHVGVGVEGLPATNRRREQSILLEVTCKLSGDVSPLTELAQVYLCVVLAQVCGCPAATSWERVESQAPGG